MILIWTLLILPITDRVRPESGTDEKMLHRNILLPLTLPWPRERSSDEVESDHSDSNSAVDSEESEYDFEMQMTGLQGSHSDDTDHVHLQVDDVNDIDVDDNAVYVDVPVVEDVLSLQLVIPVQSNT